MCKSCMCIVRFIHILCFILNGIFKIFNCSLLESNLILYISIISCTSFITTSQYQNFFQIDNHVISKSVHFLYSFLSLFPILRNSILLEKESFHSVAYRFLLLYCELNLESGAICVEVSVFFILKMETDSSLDVRPVQSPRRG